MSEQSHDGESTRRLGSEPRTPQQMSWHWAGASWVGLMRRNNQDSAFASPRLAGVADGMGGEAAGDLASIVATRRLWQASLAGADAAALAGAVKDADADIAELVRLDNDLAGMGTTICAAVFDGREVSFVHIGDSRAYIFRDGVLSQLTHDHSFVQQLIDQGQLTPEAARLHPKRSLVLRIVNGTPLSRPDKFTRTALPGDRYMFCSDGVSSFISDDQIVAAMGVPELDKAVDNLLAAAEAAGAPDNATVVITEIVDHDDAAEAKVPQVWGAAEDICPPELPDSSADVVHQLLAWGVGVSQEDTVAPRQAQAAKPRRRWLRRLIVAVVVAAVVLAGGALGTKAWLDGQYFIGVYGQQVAVFRGVPYKLGPWYMSSVVQESDVNLSDLPNYYADQVRQWRIKPADEAAAAQSLAELKAKADACIAARVDPTQAAGAEDCP